MGAVKNAIIEESYKAAEEILDVLEPHTTIDRDKLTGTVQARVEAAFYRVMFPQGSGVKAKAA